MRRVLLAWELGRGSGHVATLLQIAQRLADEGLQLVVALRDLGRGPEFERIGAKLVQSPVWPHANGMGSVVVRPPTSASMGDMLANAGLAYASELEAMLSAWRSLFRAFEIDLVLAEFAPGAALAARGVLPLAMTGNGYCQPPSDMVEFPLLHQLSPPRYRETDVCQTINQALSKFGGKPLSLLPQVFEADACFVSTLPALDPYRTLRSRPADGPVSAQLPEVANVGGSGIFAYISPGVGLPEHLVASLAQLGRELVLYAPTLQEKQVNSLRAAEVDCLQQPLDLLRELKNFGLVIHCGVGGTSAMALLAGVPQLAISLDIEKDLNGQALEQLGCGKLIMLHRPGTKVESSMMKEMARDAALAAQARDVARDQRSSVRPELIGRFIVECVRLAG